MALDDVDISKPSAVHVDADAVERTVHPGARFLPLISALLLVAALAANVFSLVTPSWLKTTTYPALFNSEGKLEPGVNGTVTTRVGALEICFFITNVTPPATAHDYCVGLDVKRAILPGGDMTPCEFAHSTGALGSAGVSWESDEAEFLRVVCDGLGAATVVLQMGVIVSAGVALLTIGASCLSRSRVGKVLRMTGVISSLLSAALALTTYTIWLTKLSVGDMHHGKCAVFTAGSVFLLAGAALAASSGLEIFASHPPPPASTQEITTKDAPEADPLPSAIAA